MTLLERTIAGIPAFDEAAAESARLRQGRLTKPPGSLGRLEELSIRIAGITATPRPRLDSGAVFVYAADHGVCAEGVSAFPQAVTAAMVANFLAGGAAINVLSRAAGARVVVTDVGVAAELAADRRLHAMKIARGTANLAAGPAMSRVEALRSVEAGIEVFEAEFAADPFALAATGDMGIGNTTASTALASVFTGRPPRELAGRGTGVDDRGLERKIQVVEGALALHRPEAADPLGVLAAVGGFEIGAIAGTIIASAARRIPILVDGFISGAAALLARALAPAAASAMIASHLSGDAGHGLMLEALGLEPLLRLGMRLGEGTGAALAIPLCASACRILDEMATFEEAAIPDKEGRI